MSAGWHVAARELVEGRRVILTGSRLASMTPRVRMLHDLGVDRVLAIASEYGVGEVPHSDEAEVLLLETTAADLLASLKRDEELVENPPTRVREAIASFDPDARAIVFPTLSWISTRPRCAGGRSWGIDRRLGPR